MNSARADRAIQEANALKKSLEADLSAAEHLLAKSERQRCATKTAWPKVPGEPFDSLLNSISLLIYPDGQTTPRHRNGNFFTAAFTR